MDSQDAVGEIDFLVNRIRNGATKKETLDFLRRLKSKIEDNKIPVNGDY